MPTILPTGEQISHAVLKYGPPALLVGGGTAGLLHLIRQYKERQAQAQPAVPSNDVLTVTLPPQRPKTAGFLQHLMANKGRYLGGAAVVGTGVGLERYIQKDQVPSSLSDAAMVTGVLAGGGLLGYGAVDGYMRNRQKEQMQERLDQAKSEYGTLLGHSLVNGKAAEVEDPNNHFPLINGLCLGVVESEFSEDGQKIAESWGSLLFGAPGGLAVLTGVLAHKWMYNRQKELESMHTQPKPSPPKQIRLVSAPPPQPDPSEDGTEQLLLNGPQAPKLAADLAGMVAGLTGGYVMGDKKEPDTVLLEKQPPISAPKATNAGPGTAQIATADGPVNVEAEDPAAAAIMQQGGTKKLTQLLKIFQVQPEVASAPTIEA